jgi:imidazolonepropionase
VAEFLPLAALYTFEPPLAARRLLELGLSVAVASDYNPGSAPCYHLPLALLLACTMGRMTPNEALKGATSVAARALGRAQRVGSLEPGKQADFALIDAPDVAHWLCHFRAERALATVKRGALVHGQLARAA